MTWIDEIERKGERRGRVEGRAQTLLEVLTARFGAVPEEVRERILAATEASLTAWTARVVSAPTLEDVIREGAKRASQTRRTTARKRARRS